MEEKYTYIIYGMEGGALQVELTDEEYANFFYDDVFVYHFDYDIVPTQINTHFVSMIRPVKRTKMEVL